MGGSVRRSLKLVRRVPESPAVRRRARTPLRRSTATVTEVIDLYLRQLPLTVSARGKPYAPKTIQDYAEHLHAVARWCGDRPLVDLDADLIGAYRVSLYTAGRTPHTVAGRENVLRIWLAWCVGRGLLPCSPLADTPRTQAGDPPVRVLSAADLARLLAACNRRGWAGTRNTAILLTLARTGLRASELVDLDLADYDPDAATLRVRSGKGGKGRLVGVPQDAAAAIEDWLTAARGREPGPLFPSERGEDFQRLRRESLTQLLHRLGERAGVPDVHPHRFRHSFAVSYLRAGGDIYQLALLLGHASITQTARYLRAIQEEEAAAEHVRVMRGRRRR